MNFFIRQLFVECRLSFTLLTEKARSITNYKGMSYTSLLAWQVSFKLSKEMYVLTKFLPKEERYGLISQMRRASLSIPSNLAEGSRRSHQKEFYHFCTIAYGSASELEVQLQYAKDLFDLPEDRYQTTKELLNRTLQLLNRLSASLRRTTDHGRRTA